MIEKKNLSILIRIFSYSILTLTLIFLINNVLTVWFDWPGVKKLFSHHEIFGFKKLKEPLEGLAMSLSYIQLLFYFHENDFQDIFQNHQSSQKIFFSKSELG